MDHTDKAEKADVRNALKELMPNRVTLKELRFTPRPETGMAVATVFSLYRQELEDYSGLLTLKGGNAQVPQLETGKGGYSMRIIVPDANVFVRAVSTGVSANDIRREDDKAAEGLTQAEQVLAKQAVETEPAPVALQHGLVAD